MNSVLQVLGLSLADEENEAWKKWGFSTRVWLVVVVTHVYFSQNITSHNHPTLVCLGVFFRGGFFLCAPRATFFYKLHVMFFLNKNKPGDKKNKLCNIYVVKYGNYENILVLDLVLNWRTSSKNVNIKHSRRKKGKEDLLLLSVDLLFIVLLPAWPKRFKSSTIDTLFQRLS